MCERQFVRKGAIQTARMTEFDYHLLDYSPLIQSMILEEIGKVFHYVLFHSPPPTVPTYPSQCRWLRSCNRWALTNNSFKFEFGF